MRFAVVVVLAVGLVVLLVVRDEVTQGEAVVGGDEVDGCHGPPPVVLVQIRRPGQARRELAERRRLAAPEVAHGVAVLAVPLRPLRGEVAHLVAAGADVPRLGDELHLADHRVLLHDLEEGGEAIDLVELAGEGGREVEPEAVDVHLEHPVPQRVHDELQRVRVAHVHAVAGAGVVGVVPLVVGLQLVIGLVVDAAHGQGRAHVVALGGVVVDHVEDHLDAGGVQGAHHALELLHLLAAVTRRRVGVLRGEEGDRVVAPVVRQALLLQRRVVDELVHRHELDGGHADALEVLDDRRVRDGAVRAADLVGNVGVELGEALHVRLVDHRFGVRRLRQPVARPVEERVDHDALHHGRGRVVVVARVGVAEVVAEHRLPPLHLAFDGLGVGVEQQLVRVEALPRGRVVRPVDAVAVALPGLHRRQVRVPDVRVDVAQFDAGLFAAVAEQAQFDFLGAFAEQREVRAAAIEGRPEGVRGSGPNLHVHLPWPSSVVTPSA